MIETSSDDLKRLRDLYTTDGVKSYTAFVTIADGTNRIEKQVMDKSNLSV